MQAVSLCVLVYEDYACFEHVWFLSSMSTATWFCYEDAQTDFGVLADSVYWFSLDCGMII